MSMVGQSESNGVFVSGVTVKELMIIGSSVLLFLFQLKNKKVDLITVGSLIFGRQIKITSNLLCPTILILPHFPVGLLLLMSKLTMSLVCCPSTSVKLSLTTVEGARMS